MVRRQNHNKKRTQGHTNVYRGVVVPGFRFNPACGEFDEKTNTVTVSGYKYKMEEIDKSGEEFSKLMDILREVDEDSDNLSES